MTGLLASKSGPGIVCAALLAVLLVLSSGDAALLIGGGLARLIAPPFLLPLGVAVCVAGSRLGWAGVLAVLGLAGALTHAFVQPFDGGSIFTPLRITATLGGVMICAIAVALIDRALILLRSARSKGDRSSRPRPRP